jgi:phage host-nuclease inhibitor protein Gam
MALSYINYPADGSTTQFDITFGYLRRTHVFVFVDNSLVGFKWISSTRIEISPAPPLEAEVRIQRLTDKVNRITDFADGQTLLAGDLDAATLQNFYLAQEMLDGITDGVLQGDVVLNQPLVGGEPLTIQEVQSILNEAARNSPVVQQLLGDVSGNTQSILTETQDRLASVTAETQARIAAIAAEAQSRQDALSAEAQARLDALNALQAQIDADVASLAVTSAALTQEIADRISAVDGVAAGLSQEVTDRISAVDGVAAGLSQEITDRATAVQANADALAQEALDRQGGDQALDTRIDAVVATVDGNSALIASEQTARISGDNALASQISVVQAATDGNAAQIAAEQTARINADTSFATSLTALTTRMGDAEAELISVNEAVSTETSARVTAINGLQTSLNANSALIASNSTAISDETSARASAVAALQALVDDNASAITTEQSVRASADSAFTLQMSALTARVGDNEAGLVSVNEAVATESSARATAISGLQTQIDGNFASIAANATAISDETGARVSAISAIQTQVDDNEAAITAEAMARSGADSAFTLSLNALTARVGDNEADIITVNEAVSTESSARASAISGLQTQVDDANVLIASNQTAISDEASARASDFNALSAEITRVEETQSAFSKPLTSTADLHSVGASVTVEDGAGVFGQEGMVTVREAAAVGYDTTAQTNGASVVIPTNIALQFSARRVRIAVLAKASSVQPAADFVVAYSTSDTGNSGAMYSALTYSWAWHTFYYQVPAASAGGTDFLGIFSTGSDGDGVDVARVMIDVAATAGDIPEIAQNTAAITSEQTARASADSAIASDVSALTTRMGDAEADIVSNQTAISNETSARASAVSGLQTQINGNAAAITSEQTARSTADSSLASDISGLTARVEDAEAGVISNSTAISDEETARAASIDLLYARFSGTRQDMLGADRRMSSGLDGLPQDVGNLNSTWYEEETADGPKVTIPVSSAQLSLKETIRPVAGHTYRCSVRWRWSGTTAPSTTIKLGFRAMDATDATYVVNRWEDVSVPAENVWATHVFEYTAAGSMEDEIWRLFFYFGGGDRDCEREVVQLYVEDVTDGVEREEAVEALVASEASARSTADTAIASDVSGLTTRMGDAEADIVSNAQAVSDEEGARVSAFEALTARMEDTQGSIVPSEFSTLDYWTTNYTAMDQPSVTPNMSLVTDDPDFGTCAEMDIYNRAIVNRTAVRLVPGRVYEVEMTAKAVSGDNRFNFHFNTFDADKVNVINNQQLSFKVPESGSNSTQLLASDGVVTNTLRFRTPGSPTAGNDVKEVWLSGDQVWLLAGWRSNAGETTASTVRIGSFKIKDVTDTVAAEASVISEASVRASADSAIASDVSGLTTRMGDAEADILSNSTAISDEEGARASQFNSLSAGMTGSGNLLANASFNLDTGSGAVRAPDGWAIWGSLTLTNAAVRTDVWALANTEDATWYLRTADYTQTSLFKEMASDPHPCQSGERIIASALTGAHRADLRAYVFFYDASGVWLGTGSSPTIVSNNTEKPGGALLSSWVRVSSAVTAPANAAYCRAVFRMVPSGVSPDAYMFITRPMLEKAAYTGQTLPSPWVPGDGDKAASAHVASEASARVSADSAIASDISGLTTRVGDAEASLTTVQSVAADAQGRAQAIYGLRTNVNGHVVGFGLSNDGATGEFAVLADKFLIVDPSNGSTVASPFSVIGGTTYITNARVGAAQIDSLSVNQLTAGSLNVNLTLDGVMDIGQGKITFDNGVYMKVQGVAFGANNDLIEWYGPKMAIVACTKANAIMYADTTGNYHLGGGVTAEWASIQNVSVQTLDLAAGSVGASTVLDTVATFDLYTGANANPVNATEFNTWTDTLPEVPIKVGDQLVVDFSYDIECQFNAFEFFNFLDTVSVRYHFANGSTTVAYPGDWVKKRFFACASNGAIPSISGAPNYDVLESFQRKLVLTIPDAAPFNTAGAELEGVEVILSVAPYAQPGQSRAIHGGTYTGSKITGHLKLRDINAAATVFAAGPIATS